MDEVTLTLRECADGWRVFEDGQQLFWFTAYEEAIATARMVASVHVDLREAATRIEMQLLGEQPVHVSTLEPRAA